MALPSVEDFLLRYPEFESQDEAVVALMLSDADAQVNETVWARLYAQGVCALAAHLLSIRIGESAAGGSGTANAGPVYSETVGPLNYKRAVLPMDATGGKALLASTSYGLRYLELLELVRPVGFMVISSATYSDSQFNL